MFVFLYAKGLNSLNMHKVKIAGRLHNTAQLHITVNSISLHYILNRTAQKKINADPGDLAYMPSPHPPVRTVSVDKCSLREK